jgi:hypothetical protein
MKDDAKPIALSLFLTTPTLSALVSFPSIYKNTIIGI